MDNIIESVDWHKERLAELIDSEDFSKIENELDKIIEKSRTKGSKDKTQRKKKGIKEMIRSAFGSKDKKSKDDSKSGGGTSYTPVDDVTKPPGNIDTQLRAVKRSSKRRRR